MPLQRKAAAKERWSKETRVWIFISATWITGFFFVHLLIDPLGWNTRLGNGLGGILNGPSGTTDEDRLLLLALCVAPLITWGLRRIYVKFVK